MVLSKLKSLAESFLHQDVKRVVITVPAHFNDAQRQATKDAGRIAGLQVLRIINEPTAAALAYGLHNKYKEMKTAHTILVYDFGGGTFDVSIIKIDNGIFEVKATDGEAYLGGDDIDVNLTNYYIAEFKKQHNIDLNENKRAVRRLRQACEKLKRNLSFTQSATINIDRIHNDLDFVASMTRAKFDQINNKIFDRTIECVKKTLKDAKMNKNDIDEVVLIGGTTRIPRVRDLVQKFFNNKVLNSCLNPDEAVAKGAAIQAAILGNEKIPSNLDLLLCDVNPLSLGIETIGGEMNVIIPRNTQLPIEKSEEFETSEHCQEEILICVYEGEGIHVIRNRKLGEFIISGLPQKPKGEVIIAVTFEINVDGILNVSAKEISGKVKEELNITARKGHLTEEEINRMIAEAEEFWDEDKKMCQINKAVFELQQYCTGLKDDLLTLEDLSDEDKKICEEKYDEVMMMIEMTENITLEDCAAKKKELHDLLVPILQQYK